MNLRGSSKRKLLFIFSLCLVIILAFSLTRTHLKNKLNKGNLEDNTKEEAIYKTGSKLTELTERFIEISPNGMNQIILYERPFTGRGQLDYRNYLSNQYLFAVRKLESGREDYVFIGDDRAGYPHWLGNNFIFFTTGCGTGCKGLQLVDIRSRESLLAVITIDPVSKDNFRTHFRDWFNSEFNLTGWVKHIRSITLRGRAYLIFEMWDSDQPVGEKRFLFTGKKLVEE